MVALPLVLIYAVALVLALSIGKHRPVKKSSLEK
jgi:hypothetical protein